MRPKDYNVGVFNLAYNWHCGKTERHNGERQYETIKGSPLDRII